MSKRRGYTPSETHLALHPPRTLIDCPCGVRFTARTASISPGIDSEDDPDLCLTCNRKSWSRLWNGNRPIEVQEHNAADLSFDLTSDSDIGEVVRQQKQRRLQQWSN